MKDEKINTTYTTNPDKTKYIPGEKIYDKECYIDACKIEVERQGKRCAESGRPDKCRGIPSPQTCSIFAEYHDNYYNYPQCIKEGYGRTERIPQGSYTKKITTTTEKYISPELDVRHKPIEILGTNLTLKNSNKTKIEFTFSWKSKEVITGRLDSDGNSHNKNDTYPRPTPNFALNMPNPGYSVTSTAAEDKEFEIVKIPEDTVAETVILKPGTTKDLSTYKDSAVAFVSKRERDDGNKNVEIAELTDKVTELEFKIKSCQDKCKADAEQCTKDKAALQKELDTIKTKVKEAVTKAGLAQNSDLDALIKKINDLQTEITNLKANNKKLTEDLATANAEIDKLKKQITQLQSDLASKTTENQKLIQEKAALQAKLDEALAKLKKIEEGLTKAKNSGLVGGTDPSTDIKALIDKISNLQTEVEGYKTKVKDLEAQLASEKSKNKTLTEKVAELEASKTANEQKIADLNNQLSNKNTEIENLNKQIKEKDAKIEELTNQGTTDTEEINKLKKEKENLQTQLDSKTQEATNLQDKVNELNTQIDNLNKEITKLKGELTQAKADLDKANKQIENLNTEITDLKKELKTCEDTCTTDKEQCAKDKATLQAKIDELQGKLDSIKVKLKEAGFEDDTDLSEAVNAAIAKVAELKKKVDTMQGQIDKLTQENATLKEQLVDANKKINNLNSEITNLKKQLEECQNKCTTDSEQCTKDKAALQEKINTLEKEISDIKEKIVKVIGDTETPKNLSNAADALLKKVSDLESKVKDSESKVKDLETKLAEKDKENSELQKEKEQLEKDKAQLEKDKQILEDGKKKLEEEKQKLEEAKKALEEKLGNTEKQIETLTKEKEKLEEEKKEIERKASSTSEEDKAKIKELEEKISEKDNSIKELENKLEKENKEKEELGKKLNNADKQTKVLGQLIKEKDKQCEENTKNWLKDKKEWERDRYYWNYYDNRERRETLSKIKELEEENEYLNKKNSKLEDKMKDYIISDNNKMSNLGERRGLNERSMPITRTIFYLGNSTVEDYQGNRLIKSITMSDSEGNITPIIRNDRTMLPVRYLVESLGMKVSWDQKTGTATFNNYNGNNVLRKGMITINSKTLEIKDENGRVINVDSKPFLQNGRFYASITNLARAFNGSHGNVTDNIRSTIEWDQKNKKVIVYKNIR